VAVHVYNDGTVNSVLAVAIIVVMLMYCSCCMIRSELLILSRSKRYSCKRTVAVVLATRLCHPNHLCSDTHIATGIHFSQDTLYPV